MASESTYIYCADVFCEACADSIKRDLRAAGVAPPDPNDESSYDSNEWPKGPYWDEESDFPCHCGSGSECLDAHVWSDGTKAGKFLENPLTSEGERYVREMHQDSPSEVTRFWMDYYDLREEEMEEDETKDTEEETAENLPC